MQFYLFFIIFILSFIYINQIIPFRSSDFHAFKHVKFKIQNCTKESNTKYIPSQQNYLAQKFLQYVYFDSKIACSFYSQKFEFSEESANLFASKHNRYPTCELHEELIHIRLPFSLFE